MQRNQGVVGQHHLQSEIIFTGVTRQVEGEKQTKQVSGTAKRAAMSPDGGYVDLSLTGKGRLV